MIETTVGNKYNWNEYFDLVQELVAQGKTTGPNQSEDMVHYTKLNFSRVKRLSKTVKVTPELSQAVAKLKSNYHLVALTEAWCGDAAQNLPIFARLVEASPRLSMEMRMRDENLELMDQHLTNGGRSIPKVIVMEADSGKVVAEWGPRPNPVQKMVDDNKALPEEDRMPYSEFSVLVQKWYNKDKTLSVQGELLDLFARLA